MPARIIDNYKAWFVVRRPKPGIESEQFAEMLAVADRRAAAIELTLSKLKVHRSPSEIERERQNLLARHSPQKLFDELIESITHSVPEYWRARDLFYRAVLLEYRHIRRCF